MVKKRFIVTGLLYVCLGFFSGLNPVFADNLLILKDANGQAFSFKKPIQKIISLAPNLTELVFSVGAGEKLIGVTQHSDFPKIAKKIPIIGTYTQLNLEKITRLNPDIILAWQGGNSKKSIQQLRRLGLSVFVFKTNTLMDIPLVIEQMGRLFGVQKIAAKKAEYFSKKLNEFRPKSNKTTTKILLQIWHNPLITLNKNSLFSEVVRFCGGANMFAELPQVAPKISVESVVANPPELILLSGRRSASQNGGNIWHNFQNTNKIPQFYVNADYINRATMRTLKAVATICNIIKTHKSD